MAALSRAAPGDPARSGGGRRGIRNLKARMDQEVQTERKVGRVKEEPEEHRVSASEGSLERSIGRLRSSQISRSR